MKWWEQEPPHYGAPETAPCWARSGLFSLCPSVSLNVRAAHGGPPSLSILLSQRNYWAALLLWFSFSVITAVPCATQLESFIWTHFSLPLKRQFEHQGLEEESYGREGSLWVTVKCWTSVSKYVMFNIKPIPQSVTGIFHSWMDGQIYNKMSCRLSSREVQEQTAERSLPAQ